MTQKLHELEREEDLKERAGEYDSDEESEDEEMQEIRSLAKQIRSKKQQLVAQSREKDITGPRMPRTAKKVRRRKSNLKPHLENPQPLEDLLSEELLNLRCQRFIVKLLAILYKKQPTEESIFIAFISLLMFMSCFLLVTSLQANCVSVCRWRGRIWRSRWGILVWRWTTRMTYEIT